MRILHVACMPFPSMQGTQVYVRGLLRAEAALGHKVALLCYGYGTEDICEGYEIIRIPNIPGYRNLRAGPDGYKVLLDILIAYKVWFLEADIIHVHNYEAPIAAYIRRLRSTTPIVYTAHNLMSQELKTYFVGSIRKSFFSFLGTTLDACIPRFADHVIAIHPDTEQRLRVLGCKNVCVITPGVESLIPCAHLEKSSKVVYTGNLDAYQNIEIFLWLVRHNPEIDFQIITSSDPHIFHKNIHSNLEVIHTSKFSVVQRLLSQASLSIIPRVECSGFPMKMLNSLVLGVPVLGFADVLPQMEGVSTVTSKEELHTRLRDLIRDHEALALLGQKGRDEVFAKHLWEKKAIETEKIYNSLNNT